MFGKMYFGSLSIALCIALGLWVIETKEKEITSKEPNRIEVVDYQVGKIIYRVKTQYYTGTNFYQNLNKSVCEITTTSTDMIIHSQPRYRSRDKFSQLMGTEILFSGSCDMIDSGRIIFMEDGSVEYYSRAIFRSITRVNK